MAVQLDDISSTGSARFYDGNYGNNNLVCSEVICMRLTDNEAISNNVYIIFVRVTNLSRSTQRLTTGVLSHGLYSSRSDSTPNIEKMHTFDTTIQSTAYHYYPDGRDSLLGIPGRVPSTM